MLWFVTFAAPALVLGLLASLYVAWQRLTVWTPVAARVVGTDYPDADRFRDRPWGRLGQAWRPFDWRYEDGERWTVATLAYTDAEGCEHRATHGCLVPAGSTEEAAHLLWYDPADPRRSSLAGPGLFLLLAGGCAAGLAALLGLARAVTGA